MIAPYDDTEDYSTASLLKNSGPNLTMEYLAKLSIDEMIQEILRKAGFIDYERLVRILRSACNVAKKPFPKEAVLVNDLI